MIWLIVLALLALFAGIGYLKGAIRMTVSLIGLIVSLFVAVPLGQLITPIFTASGMTNLLWLAIFPPVTAFFIVGLIFIGIAFFVHYKIYQKYKFSVDEATRLSWDRMSQRTGLCLGILTGSTYLGSCGHVLFMWLGISRLRWPRILILVPSLFLMALLRVWKAQGLIRWPVQ